MSTKEGKFFVLRTEISGQRTVSAQKRALARKKKPDTFGHLNYVLYLCARFNQYKVQFYLIFKFLTYLYGRFKECCSH